MGLLEVLLVQTPVQSNANLDQVANGPVQFLISPRMEILRPLLASSFSVWLPSWGLFFSSISSYEVTEDQDAL